MRLNRKGFSKSLNAKAKKTNNHPAASEAKALIRRNVLAEIGAANARVFDAFAGAGEMYRKVWKDAAAYTGCDQTWYRDDERECFVADNRLILRAVDLGQFNIFDLDAWGSPWEQVMIVMARRKLAKGERVGILLTEGCSLNLKLGGLPIALQKLTGLRGRLSGLNKAQDEIIDIAINAACAKLGAAVQKRWQATRTSGAAMRYIGLVLQEVTQ